MKRSFVSAHGLNFALFLAAAGIPTVMILVHSYLDGQSLASHLGIELVALLVVVLTSALLYSHFSLLRLVRHLVREMLRPSPGPFASYPGEKNITRGHDLLANEVHRLTESLEQRDSLATELQRLTESLEQRDALADEVRRLTGSLEQRDAQLREIRAKVQEGILQSRHYAESIQEANQRLQALVTEAPVGIKIVDLEGRILLSNPASERIFGWTEQQMHRRLVWELFGEQPESVADLLRAAASGQPIHGQEIRIVRQDGSSKVINITTANLHNVEGKVTGCMLVLADVTKRQEAEEELVRLRKAVESTGEAMFLTDPDGTITWINPAFTRVYGYTAEEVVGHATPRVLKSGGVLLEQYQKFWTRILNKEGVTAELVNKTKDGRLVTIGSSVNPILDERGRILGFLAIQRDISDRKKT